MVGRDRERKFGRRGYRCRGGNTEEIRKTDCFPLKQQPVSYGHLLHGRHLLFPLHPQPVIGAILAVRLWRCLDDSSVHLLLLLPFRWRLGRVVDNDAKLFHRILGTRQRAAKTRGALDAKQVRLDVHGISVKLRQGSVHTWSSASLLVSSSFTTMSPVLLHNVRRRSAAATAGCWAGSHSGPTTASRLPHATPAQPKGKKMAALSQIPFQKTVGFLPTSWEPPVLWVFLTKSES